MTNHHKFLSTIIISSSTAKFTNNFQRFNSSWTWHCVLTFWWTIRNFVSGNKMSHRRRLDYPEIPCENLKSHNFWCLGYDRHSTPQLTFYITLKPHLGYVSAHSSHHSLCPSHPKLQFMTVCFSHLSDMFERVWCLMTLNWDPPPNVLMPVLCIKEMQPDKTCSSLQLAFCRHTQTYINTN